MYFFRKFPYALAVCVALTLLVADTKAQSTTAKDPDGRTRLENDLVVVPDLPNEEGEPEVISTAPVVPSGLGQIEQVMLAAIDARMGVPYRMGSEGPNRYDCSGFVWSVFQTAGISFERGSARTFWSRFTPVTDEDKYKFGTLVFFNHLGHVGIVADANGFYHASSSRGVTYSTFSEYWTKRITGFRRVQLSPEQTHVAASGK